jgi:hypothetical protein
MHLTPQQQTFLCLVLLLLLAGWAVQAWRLAQAESLPVAAARTTVP